MERNKALTKQHWQRFEDFCNQQKMPIVAVGATPAALSPTSTNLLSNDSHRLSQSGD